MILSNCSIRQEGRAKLAAITSTLRIADSISVLHKSFSLVDKCLLSTNYVLGTVSGTEKITVSKTDQYWLPQAYTLSHRKGEGDLNDT